MKNPRGLVKGFGCRPVVSCETASNRDPLPKQHKALTSHAEFDQHGVPIGADRNPGEPYNSPSTVNTFALIYDGVPIGCRNTITADIRTEIVDDNEPAQGAAALTDADVVLTGAWRSGFPAAPKLRLLQVRAG